MSGVRYIGIEPLTALAVADFGTAVLPNPARPTGTGPWWACWEGCAGLGDGQQWLGFVQAGAAPPEVTEMEREPGTELVIPVAGEIVQIVAHGLRDAAGVDRPDGRTARAFVLRPGQALMMNPGVWHAAAFGLNASAAYFYIARRRKAEDSEGRGGWVALAEGQVLQPHPGRMAPDQGTGDRE